MTQGGIYDLVVIGAGHNGLATAILAKKRLKRVLVLEKRPFAGGLAASEEFCPGFWTPGVLHETTGLRPWVVEELGLARHGLTRRADETPVFNPGVAGRGLLLWRDAARAADEIAQLAAKDAKAYFEYRAFLDRIRPAVAKVFDAPPADLVTMSVPALWGLLAKAVSLRRLGKSDMMEVLRIAPMCVADWLDEWFESDLLKTTLAHEAIFGSFTGPWSPGTNANLLMAEAVQARPVVGGPQAVIKAMLLAAKAVGVEIRTGVEVERVHLNGRKVEGVSLRGGETIAAAKVAAACDPKQLFLKLIDATAMTQAFEHNVKNIRVRGTTAKVTLALAALPAWRDRPGLKVEYVRTGESFDQMERAFDFVKYKEMASRPLLDMYVPTLEAPELAPEGRHVLSILAHFAPVNLVGGWTEARRSQLYDNVVATLEEYAPGIGRQVIAAQTLTPADLERDFNLSGGHVFHGEHAADQMLMRPTPECSRYETPFGGLFLCGSGAHPGGGITGAPGAFAARAILKS